jgi:hypothetical protein
MKEPKPDKLVVIEGTPICRPSQRPYKKTLLSSRTTVHSAGVYPHLRTESVASSLNLKTKCSRLVVAWEDTQMAATNELLIVKSQYGIVRVQEIGVENDLDSVRGPIE